MKFHSFCIGQEYINSLKFQLIRLFGLKWRPFPEIVILITESLSGLQELRIFVARLYRESKKVICKQLLLAALSK